jgi:hypothetical protein
VTFPDTKTILDGVSVGGLAMDDVQCVLNLRDAWNYLLSSLDRPLNLDYLCKINEYIARNESLQWGVLRTGRVSIGGTEYLPPVPERAAAERELESILKIPCVTQRAIRCFLWSARSQLFWDGNKRTATLASNKILIAEGKGIFTIPEKALPEFNRLLTSFYDLNDYSIIDGFLFEQCIHGIIRE